MKFSLSILKNILPAFLLALSLSLGACSGSSGDAGLPPSPDEPATEADKGIAVSGAQFEAAGMQLGGLESRVFHNLVQTNGIFDSPPSNQAMVSAYFGGYVKSFDLLPGQHIHKGEVMFILENPDYIKVQQEYLEAMGELEYLRSDFERQKALLEGRVSSEKQYMKAESDFKVTEARCASLRKQLELMNISSDGLRPDNIRSTITVRAPLSGIVTSVAAHTGMFLNPSDVAATIMNTDHMHLEVSVFEKDLPQIAVGQEIRFKLPKETSFERRAKVHLVNRFIDPESRTASVHAHLEEEMAGYAPGMYAEVEIWTQSDTALALPVEAVVRQQEAHFVLVERAGEGKERSFEQVAVQPGRSEGGFVEILNAADFPKGARFVTEGAFALVSE